MTSGLSILLGIFTLAAALGAPLGLSMLASGFAYLIATHQDIGLVTDQTMNGLYNSYLLIAIPLFIFVANVMNASGVIGRLLACGSALVGHLPGGLAQVNIVSNLIFSGMSGSAVADASGPGLIVARMAERQARGRTKHIVMTGNFPAATAAYARSIAAIVRSVAASTSGWPSTMTRASPMKSSADWCCTTARTIAASAAKRLPGRACASATAPVI